MTQHKLSILFLMGLPAIILVACNLATPAIDVNFQMTQAVQTAFASLQQTHIVSTPVPRVTTTSQATPVRTPPALPPMFLAGSLNPLDKPHTYIPNSCQYLKDKWTSTNAAPGTIVMVVMFHSISKGVATAANEISDQDFKKLMNDLHDLGFQAIDTQHLDNFLYSNAKIPQRSVLLTQDDRHHAENFTDHFLPYYKEWGWPVVTGWISAQGGQDPVLAENVALSKEGWVDYQAHGVFHNIPMSDSSDDAYITSELQGSITNIQTYFGKTPIAIIWPGGGFGLRPVQFARKFGYQLGFTINPRGPLMFNWVPLADQQDPGRPLDIPEGPINDPLMVLPRFWDTDARSYLDQVRQIGNDAATYAQQNKTVELDYYNIMCSPKLGPIP